MKAVPDLSSSSSHSHYSAVDVFDVAGDGDATVVEKLSPIEDQKSKDIHQKPDSESDLHHPRRVLGERL